MLGDLQKAREVWRRFPGALTKALNFCCLYSMLLDWAGGATTDLFLDSSKRLGVAVQKKRTLELSFLLFLSTGYS